LELRPPYPSKINPTYDDVKTEFVACHIDSILSLISKNKHKVKHLGRLDRHSKIIILVTFGNAIPFSDDIINSS